MDEPLTLRFDCAVCGEPNELLYDPEEGERQELVMDCWVCCRPLCVELSAAPHEAVRIHVRPDSGP